MEIVTKAQAKAQGLARYFTGKSCRNGHIAERRTKGGACVLCRRDNAKSHKRRRRADPNYRLRDQERTVRWRTSPAGRQWNGDYSKERWAAKKDDEQFRNGQRQSVRRWRLENPGKKREVDARWRAENKDKVEFKEKSRVRVLNRIAKKRSAQGSYSSQDIELIYERQAGVCACGCGRSLAARNYHIDHKMPLARGGSNWPENIQLLAPFCNLSKGTRTTEEWARARAFPHGAHGCPA